MGPNIIKLDRDGAVATVTINNPEKRNALTFAAWERLRDVIAELEGGRRSALCLGHRGQAIISLPGRTFPNFPHYV